MKKGWIILGSIIGGLVLLGLIIGGTLASNYNRFVTLNEGITNSWAEIDNQLQRRNDLIPNLVNTVKGYAKHEKEIFETVAEARSKLIGAKTVPEKINASNQLDGALGRLLAIAENYPTLKANENFIRLQDELAGTENRIAVARGRYNDVIQAYNTAVIRFPGNIIAGMFNFQRKDIYFKAQEQAKEVPKVQF